MVAFPPKVNHSEFRRQCLGTKYVVKLKRLNRLVIIYDALRNWVSFVQFKKREKHPWMSVTFSKVAGFSHHHSSSSFNKINA